MYDHGLVTFLRLRIELYGQNTLEVWSHVRYNLLFQI